MSRLRAAERQLKLVPLNVGDWIGTDQSRKLIWDAPMAVLQRKYENKLSGKQITVLLAAGHPRDISAYSPNACFCDPLPEYVTIRYGRTGNTLTASGFISRPGIPTISWFQKGVALTSFSTDGEWRGATSATFLNIDSKFSFLLQFVVEFDPPYDVAQKMLDLHEAKKAINGLGSEIIPLINSAAFNH